ncbi:Cerato-platanin [Metarhizium album ARSEF 1941]|uniref:Cerato-platanin n=1 Tax=Metarhizium album (strain ARSEF 1941) TaxID=1081103 RepID=A0A0B2WKA4_METAS|nr:Cerato-platanin [Metarhizium album ARSEF 1941]KHN94109.1 Cerato-platanin [Metarhizium album ARSEF 1941]
MRIPSLAATGLSLSQLGAYHVSASVPPPKRDDTSPIWATPHDSYSSSIGVLGCKINTNRVAYWPQPVDCDNICVSLEYRQRQVYLLRIDQSTGAHDVSYDAWNYLLTGRSATDDPTSGGPVAMQYRNVDASKCKSLIHTKDNKLPLSAANSINFLASCLAEPNSWVAKNYMLINIVDSICTLGVDERCKLDWPEANQPSCPHTLGNLISLKDAPVYNIQYPSGKKVVASSGVSAPGGAETNPATEDNAARHVPCTWSLLAWWLIWYFSDAIPID